MALEPPDEEGVVAPDALLDQRYRGAAFLVSRPDLDMGDATETSVARVLGLGVRGILAPAFETKLYDRCLSSGVLPLMLTERVIAEIADCVAASAPAEMTVDLEAQILDCTGMERLTFDVSPRVRHKLLTGLTDLEEKLRHVQNAASLRSADRGKRPWLYQTHPRQEKPEDGQD